jgi:ABC-type phosphate transport system substrate-binding protein
MKRYGIIILALVLAGLCQTAPAQDGSSFVVIVHPDNPADSVSKKKVSRLLLKELSKWDGGLLVQPVDLDSNSPVRQEFSREVHGRSVSSIKNYWQRQIFSGKSVPPPEVPSDSAVIAHVSSHPGGIGYVSASTRLDGVKRITLSAD